MAKSAMNQKWCDGCWWSQSQDKHSGVARCMDVGAGMWKRVEGGENLKRAGRSWVDNREQEHAVAGRKGKIEKEEKKRWTRTTRVRSHRVQG